MTEKNLYPSDQADKVLVRMPDGMRDRLKDAAKANNRTMNAEIVARLEDSFQPKKPLTISADDMQVLLETDKHAKQVFAEQMQKAASQLLKEDRGARDATLELLTAAILLAEDRRKSRQDAAAMLSNDEAIKIVQTAKSKTQAKPTQPK